MHLLSTQPGGFVSDDNIADLGQTPAELVILCSGDSSLALLLFMLCARIRLTRPRPRQLLRLALLGFFSLSNGKLPTYIMPCLLPLALLMGHTLTDLINRHKARTICLNGLLNFVIGMAAMIGLIYLQIARPLYSNSHAEMFSLSLAFIVLLVWILANLLQAFRPLTLWAMPALGIGLLVILLPASMPAWIADNEMPDQFVLEHLEELQQTQALLSNELESASALAWRLNRSDVALYDTEGELRYGLQYAGSAHRKVELEAVQAWLKAARQRGSVGVLMRVNSTSEMREAGQLPPGGKRYYKGYLELIVYPQLP